MLRLTRHILFVSLIILLAVLFITQFEYIQSLHDIRFLSSPEPSSSTTDTLCPSIYDQEPLPAIDHSKQICSPIDSRLPEFSTELCIDPHSRCNTFSLIISRTSKDACSSLESLPNPSYIDEVNEWMRKERGPDAFYIRTDGAQRAGYALAEYEGECRYRFDVQLRNPGPLFVSGWWTYSRYEGFAETNMSWPEMNLLPLFNPINLNTCSPECTATQQYASPLNRHITSLNNASLPELPPCPKDAAEPVEGIYIPTHPLDIMYPPYPIHQPIELPTMNRYTFHPLTCKWDHGGLRFSGWEKWGAEADWSPYAPSHAPKPDPSTKKVGIERCLSHPHQKLFFIGDSHGRVLYDAVSHRLTQNYLLRKAALSPSEPWVPEVMKESEKVGSKHSRVPPEGPTDDLEGNIELEFSWDPRGLEFLFSDERCELISGSDVIITSLGAHWANVNETTYEDEIPRILSSITECEHEGKERKYIFLTLPAAIQRTDEWVKGFKDHRTNLKSAYQSQWALNYTRSPSSKWMSINFFQNTLPFTLETLSIDLAHYFLNDALDGIVDEVIGKTGVCE